MTKREKFLAIIEFLEKLDESQFDYGDFVSKTDDNGCGTVCCVAGWFPAIFPNDFKWESKVFTGIIETNGNYSRTDFLEIDGSFDLALFFGEEFYQIDLNLPITDSESKLPEVIHLFKTYVEKYVPE
jgi:hypothetical protein